MSAKTRISALSLLLLLSNNGCSTLGFLDIFASSPSMPVVVEPIGEIKLLENGSGTTVIQAKPSKADVEPLAITDNQDVQHSDTDQSDILEENDTPFSMVVAQKFYEGDALILKVHLSAKAEIPTSDLAVEAVGLENGEVRDRDVQFVDQVVASDRLAQNQKIAISLRLEDPSITEYQIRGMWGADARKKRESESKSTAVAENKIVEPKTDTSETQLLAKSTPQAAPTLSSPVPSNVPIEGLNLDIVRIDRKSTDCGERTCPEVVTLFGVLENNSTMAVSQVVLAVGIFWQEGSSTPKFPELGDSLAANEREVGLPEHILLPGEQKRIRLHVDKELPVIPGGKFIPKARILRSSALLAAK